MYLIASLLFLCLSILSMLAHIESQQPEPVRIGDQYVNVDPFLLRERAEVIDISGDYVRFKRGENYFSQHISGFRSCWTEKVVSGK